MIPFFGVMGMDRKDDRNFIELFWIQPWEECFGIGLLHRLLTRSWPNFLITRFILIRHKRLFTSIILCYFNFHMPSASWVNWGSGHKFYEAKGRVPLSHCTHLPSKRFPSQRQSSSSVAPCGIGTCRRKVMFSPGKSKGNNSLILVVSAQKKKWILESWTPVTFSRWFPQDIG